MSVFLPEQPRSRSQTPRYSSLIFNRLCQCVHQPPQKIIARLSATRRARRRLQTVHGDNASADVVQARQRRIFAGQIKTIVFNAQAGKRLCIF